jgi:hypothetical protein
MLATRAILQGGRLLSFPDGWFDLSKDFCFIEGTTFTTIDGGIYSSGEYKDHLESQALAEKRGQLPEFDCSGGS